MMTARVVHISGPGHSGKTTVARRIAGRCADAAPCYLRFVRETAGPAPRSDLRLAIPEMRQTRQCYYSPERVFEQVPAALGDLGQKGRTRLVILETDVDACFRMAYRYDLRVFVMAGPEDVGAVFRSQNEADQALRLALHDTGTFADEIFGLEHVPVLDDSSALLRLKPNSALPAREGMQSDELERVADTALGAELTARVRLQPNYHTLLESDVVILNAGLGGVGEVVEVCARRLERLIESLPTTVAKRPLFFCCDPLDDADPLASRSLDAMLDLLTRGKGNPA
jgi:hypothetical protein